MAICLSCSKDEAQPKESILSIPQLLNSQLLTSQTLKGQLISKYNSKSIHNNLRTSSGSMETLEFAFEDATISDYSDTEVQSITAYEVSYDGSQEVYYSFGTYVENDVLSDASLIMRTEVAADETYIIDYYDASTSEYIGQVTVQNGIVVNARTKPTYSTRFAKCVGGVINSFVGGTWQGAGAGLLCMAAGPECAAAIGIVCGIQSI